MTFEVYKNQSMQMVHLKMNMICDINPHLIKELDRSVNHPLIRKLSFINENTENNWCLCYWK